MQKEIIIQGISKLLLPFIMLFAFYLQIHGEDTPGGGFQSGVIMASGLILYAIVFGTSALGRVITLEQAKFYAALGVLGYLMVGCFSLVLGSNFLDYSRFATSSISAQKNGIFIVEAFIAMTVFSGMMLIFLSMLHKRQ